MTEPITEAPDLSIAPGSVVVVRDREWLVRETEQAADGLPVHVQGLSEQSHDTRDCFYQSLDDSAPSRSATGSDAKRPSSKPPPERGDLVASNGN